MNPTFVKVGDKEIDVREGCVYVKLGNTTFYLEDSDAAPMYCAAWVKGESGHHIAHFQKEDVE